MARLAERVSAGLTGRGGVRGRRRDCLSQAIRRPSRAGLAVAGCRAVGRRQAGSVGHLRAVGSVSILQADVPGADSAGLPDAGLKGAGLKGAGLRIAGIRTGGIRTGGIRRPISGVLLNEWLGSRPWRLCRNIDCAVKRPALPGRRSARRCQPPVRPRRYLGMHRPDAIVTGEQRRQPLGFIRADAEDHPWLPPRLL